MKIILSYYHSPFGDLSIGSYDDKLCLCDWRNAKCRQSVLDRIKRILGSDIVNGDSAVIDKAKSQLDEYFAGIRTTFHIPLITAGTEFQKIIWNTLSEITYGHTTTYARIADGIGKPQSVRAVANAIGQNAISIIIPCHRVIGTDGTLTGYAGGLEAKRRLLNLESSSPTK